MAKTKALISFAVTAKLICVFVFAYAKKTVFSRRGSYNAFVVEILMLFAFKWMIYRFAQDSNSKQLCVNGLTRSDGNSIIFVP